MPNNHTFLSFRNSQQATSRRLGALLSPFGMGGSGALLYNDVCYFQEGENRQREHALPVGVSKQLYIDRSLSHNNQIALELSPLGLLVAKPTHASFKFSLGVLLTNFPHIFHNSVLIGCVHVHYILSFLFCFF